jgi:MtrB/PioB family decaheme-associated outer membrane protein
MKTTHNCFRLSALSTALFAAFGTAHAGEAEVNQLIKPDSTVSVGIGNWSGDRPQQGTYDGMRKKGGYGLLDADIAKRDDDTGTWLKLKVINFGLDNREIKGEYLRQGDIGASFEYSRISRDDPNTFTTRLQGIGTTTQTVSTTAVPGPVTNLNLGTDRDAISLGFYKNLMPDLDLTVSFKNEDKKGNRNWSRGSAVEFVTEPINSTTRQLEAVLNYTTKTLQLSGGYYGSWYDNKYNMVTVQTAGLVAPTYLSLPLDNQAHQLFLNGGYAFSPSTRGTLKLEYTRATQNEHLPMQDIAGLSLAGSPQNLNGAINTTLVQLGMTSRPISELSLVANLRYHNVKDVTPVNQFVRAGAGTCVTPPGANQCVDNTPFTYKTISGKLEGTYRLPDGYSLIAGLDERRQDRTIPQGNTLGAGGTDNQRVVPFRIKVDETTYRLQLRRSFSDVLNGSLGYLNSKRTGSGYISAATGAGGAASDLINPINVADRNRDKIRMVLDWTPVEKLTLQFNAEESKDDYAKNQRYGMRDGKGQLYSFDASYMVADNWKLNGWYSYDYSQARQLNSRTATTSNKDNNLQDTGNALGIGLRGDVTGQISIGADLEMSRNVSKYQQTLDAAQTATISALLPDVQNKMTKLTLFSTYALDKNSEVRVSLVHERWTNNDWSWMLANGTPWTFGTTTDGTTVTAAGKQTSTFIGARYIYKFQ